MSEKHHVFATSYQHGCLLRVFYLRMENDVTKMDIMSPQTWGNASQLAPGYASNPLSRWCLQDKLPKDKERKDQGSVFFLTFRWFHFLLNCFLYEHNYRKAVRAEIFSRCCFHCELVQKIERPSIPRVMFSAILISQKVNRKGRR